jgi:tetratricopeptide (TPR) repeat protein
MNSAPPTLRRLFLPALVFVIAFVTFLPALDGQFLNWDDDLNFLANPNFRGLGWGNLRWMFTTTLTGHWIPLSWLTLGLNYTLGGMNPWGYHLGNMLLHAGNAVFLYFVAGRLLARAGAAVGGVALSAGAVLTALLFAVHPLRVESVVWITERRDVQGAFFFLLAILGYLRAVESGRDGRLAPLWRGLSIVAFAAALLSKASTLMLPAALLVLDVYPLRRLGQGWRRLSIEKLPYFALAAADLAVAWMAVQRETRVSDLAEHGVAGRLTLVFHSVFFYPWKWVWPAGLSPMYEVPQRIDPLASRFLVAIIAVLLVTAALVALRRRWPAGLAAWTYSALMILPVSGALHAGYQLAQDRWSYWSGMGFALLAGGGLARLLDLRARARVSALIARSITAGAAALVLILGAEAWEQSKVWRDTETLWRRAASVDPSCMVCQNNLGNLLLDQDRLAEAETAFRAAVTARPESAGPRNNLGAVLVRLGRYDEAAAQFREAIRLAPDRIGGALNLGLLYVVQGKFAEAIPLLRHVLAQRPGRPDARAALSTALVKRADELRREGRSAAADSLVRESAALARDRAATEALPKVLPGSR